MTFAVIPAIDVTGGRLGVWTPDGPRELAAFGGDPLAAARAHLEAGARWLHVVDMDLAFGGTPPALGLVRDVVALGASVQFSGGVVTGSDVAAAIGAGASRVVLGSGALHDEATVVEIVAAHGRRVIVGLEVDEGRIRPRSSSDVDLDLMATVGWLVAVGAPAFLVTSVRRVATAAGPDTALIRRVVRAGRPVLAAGGIGSLSDLREVADAGAAGAVVGRAALDGGVDLAAAIAWGDARGGA